MYNHNRTLLLNTTAATFDGMPMLAPIPATFAPIRLPAYLQSLYSTLFVSSWHPTAKDAAASILMQFMHTPELLPYVSLFDTRLTYRTDSATLMDVVQAAMQYTVAGTSDIEPRFIVDYTNLPTSSSVLGWHRWTFTQVNTTDTRLAYSRGGSSIITIVPGGGDTQSVDVPLIADYLTHYFKLPTNYLNGIYTITADTVVPIPSSYTTQLEAKLDVAVRAPDVQSQLFASSLPEFTDILTQLKSYWFTGPESQLRIGSALTAYVIQCEITRRTQVGNG